jgi:hypothetical protein
MKKFHVKKKACERKIKSRKRTMNEMSHSKDDIIIIQIIVKKRKKKE